MVLSLFAVGLAIAVGAWSGTQAGKQAQLATQTVHAGLTLKEQFDLAVQNMTDGQYELARQRLEYIITQDPSYPGVTEKLVEITGVLYATATPTLLPPTITPTPTPDLRPVAELLEQAKQLAASQKWTETIDTLISLRKADSTYQTARVDGLLFLCLRQRGVDKIYQQGKLEEGIYDLTLAERFGPIDIEASVARELARLYIFGLSFWEVYPERAVEFFSQVAAALPGLRDGSGWTANERYRAVLLQYGEKLAAEKDWCGAKAQYELALSMRADPTLQQNLDRLTELCLGYTPTAAPVTPTSTPLTPEPPLPTRTPTKGPRPTRTDTEPVPSTPTDTPEPPTDTPEPPTDTPEPPTDTPEPPTDTPEPPTDTPKPPTPNGTNEVPPG
jgi:hypothetical protein